MASSVNRSYSDAEIAELKSAFDKEVETSGAEKIILSSDEFLRGLEPQQMKLIKTLSSNYETFIVVYFRRQDEFVISSYNQIVKSSLDYRTPLLDAVTKTEFSGQRFMGCLDSQRDFLSFWSDMVGDDHVIVSAYEGEVKKNIIKHFLEHVGVEYNKKFFTEKRKNTSVPYTLIKLKRLLNSCIDGGGFFNNTLDKVDLQELSDLLVTMRMNEGRKVNRATPLSPQTKHGVIKQYESTNQYIAEKYLGRPTLFEEPLPSDDEFFDESTSLDGEEIEEIITLLFALCIKNESRINKLSQFDQSIRQLLKKYSFC